MPIDFPRLVIYDQFTAHYFCPLHGYRHMRLSARSTWAIGCCGLAFAIGLFALYVFRRDVFPSTPLPQPAEELLVFALLASIVAFITGRAACVYYQQFLLDLSNQIAALRKHPATHRVQALPSRMGPLQRQIEALSTSYRQALADVVEAQQALAALQALQGKADAESGHSHSFIYRDGVDHGGVMWRMVARLTPNLHWMAATPALQLFLGSSLNALVARPFMDMVHTEDAAGLARAIQDALRDGEAHNVIFRLRGSDGGERHVQMDALTRYTDTGAPLHLRCHFLDVTDRIRTEQELRGRTEELSQANRHLRRFNSDLERLKESYRDLYHQAPVMYFSLDEQGRFAACNETLARVLGHARHDLLEQHYPRILTPASQRRYREDPGIYQRATEIESRWVKKDGTVIDVWIRTTPVIDEKGRFVRSRSAALDVTERNRLANELRAKAEELERANRLLLRINQELDQFTYVVSHDLKEPLRTLQAFSTLLQQDCGDRLGAEGQEYLDYMLQASRRLSALIDDLLALSRAGRVIHAPHAFSLTSAVQTVLSDLQDLIQRRQASVRVEEPLPEILGDPERIIQLLSNLVVNSLKYNRSETPEVVIGASANGECGMRHAESGQEVARGYVTVQVRDNGIGIEPQYHEQIFGLFRRLHRRDEYEGTGAGLTICKKIVESHGGGIWVESQAGAGATFFFTLPCPDAAALSGCRSAAEASTIEETLNHLQSSAR